MEVVPDSESIIPEYGALQQNQFSELINRTRKLRTLTVTSFISNFENFLSDPKLTFLFSEVLLDTSKFTTELSQKGWIFPNNSKVYLIFWNNILGSGSWGRRLEFFRTGSLVQFSISRRDNNKLRMHNAKAEKLAEKTSVK